MVVHTNINRHTHSAVRKYIQRYIGNTKPGNLYVHTTPSKPIFLFRIGIQKIISKLIPYLNVLYITTYYLSAMIVIILHIVFGFSF